MYENLLAGLDIFTITSAFVGASLQEAFIADVEGNSGVSFANDRGNLFFQRPRSSVVFRQRQEAKCFESGQGYQS